MASRIKKGDTVIVLAGKDKGKRGQVTEVITKLDKVVIEGINSVITHKKQTKESAGGRIPKNAPVHLSNVALLDPKNDVATRVGFIVKEGKKVRVAKKSGEVLDG
jgi:large subunit ribosomal protein L24